MKIYAASLMATKQNEYGVISSHTVRSIIANNLNEAIGKAVNETRLNWPEEGWNYSLPSVTEITTQDN